MENMRTASTEEQGDKLVHDGKTYEPELIRRMWLAANELKVGWSEDYDQNPGDQDMESIKETIKALRPAAGGKRGPYISGWAKLEKQRETLSIIGDSANRARNISLSLRPVELELHKTSAGRNAATVVLGFNKADPEIGDTDDWWVELYVPTATFTALVTSIRSGLLASLSIGLQFSEQIYTVHQYAPPSMPIDWFLRPDKGKGGWDSPEPELAYGYGATITMSEKPWVASTPLEDAEEPAEKKEEASGNRTVLPDVRYQSPDIRALTQSINRIGWAFFVLAVLALLLK